MILTIDTATLSYRALEALAFPANADTHDAVTRNAALGEIMKRDRAAFLRLASKEQA